MSDWKTEHERREQLAFERRQEEHRANWDRMVAEGEQRRQREEAEKNRRFEEWQRKFRCYLCGRLPEKPAKKWVEGKGGNNGSGGYYRDDWNKPEGFRLCECHDCKPRKWTCGDCGALGMDPKCGRVWKCRKCWGF